jgi:acetyltransferase-like isoleucine patch superfamily enzyme
VSARVHPTAIVEDGVRIGEGTAIWDNVHIRHGTEIGEQCIVGGKTVIAYGVRIGNRVKINSFVYIPHGVTIEDGVMISAGTMFTNDRFPRAATPDLEHLRPSEPDEQTLCTLVRRGATIGAQSTIGNDLVIGQFAMVGMGALVTKSVPDFHLVLGHPARSVGYVCRCGQVLARFPAGEPVDLDRVVCAACGLPYSVREGQVSELAPPEPARESGFWAASRTGDATSWELLNPQELA